MLFFVLFCLALLFRLMNSSVTAGPYDLCLGIYTTYTWDNFTELFRSVLTSTHLPIFWILVRYYKVFIVFIFKSMGSAASCLPFSSLFFIFRAVAIPTTLPLLCLCFPWSLFPVSSRLLLLSQSSLSKSTPPLLHTRLPPPCHRYGTWDRWFR